MRRKSFTPGGVRARSVRPGSRTRRAGERRKGTVSGCVERSQRFSHSVIGLPGARVRKVRGGAFHRHRDSAEVGPLIMAQRPRATEPEGAP